MIAIGRAPLAIDVTTGIDGVSFEKAWEGRNDLEIDGHSISVVGLSRRPQSSASVVGKAEYIRTKRAAGRLKDLTLLQEVGLLPDET